MEDTTFDSLTRSLSEATTRRGIGQLIGGLALGSLLASPLRADAKKGGNRKNKKKKVTLCHNGQTIAVSQSAVKSHKRRGATTGPCRGGAQASICADGVKNGGETDVDCGGICPRCATGKTCASRSDCASARCANGTCQTCANALADCGTDSDGSMCACRDHASGQRFCTKINGRLFPAGTPCSVCQGAEQCFPINGGANGIECILPCGA